MITLYLVCFAVGLVFSVLAGFSGAGHLHLGHLRLPHLHLGHRGMPHLRGAGHISAVNGFTVAAFLCWFGGAGYLLETHTAMLALLVLALAIPAGLLGASLLHLLLFRVLLPRERVLSAEDTRMEGTVARVSGSIRAGAEGTGEILFTQAGTRRSAAARSRNGLAIARGTEVVVLGYSRGIATVEPLPELAGGELGRLEKGADFREGCSTSSQS